MKNISSKQSCAFCSENKVQFKEQIIFENNLLIAIHARRPLTKGHVIIFTKKHRNTFLDLQQKEILAIFNLSKKITKSLKHNYKTTGYNFFSNAGVSAGQLIPHVHFHILGRTAKEKISPFKIMNNPTLYKKIPRLSEKKLKAEAQKIKSKL